MAIVWPCALSVDEYLAAGRNVDIPRADCPECGKPMEFRSGYERHVRAGGISAPAWVARGQCVPCRRSHALLPSFLLVGRLDVVSAVGGVIVAVVDGSGGVRPAAGAADVPHTTARDWVRRFSRRAPALGAGFAALAVELGDPGSAARPGAHPVGLALGAIRGAWRAGLARAGVAAVALWAFASIVSGGRLLGTTSDPLWFVIGSRRFMPPAP